jgi:GNAT superfamily N-acetyltransferase
VIEAYEVESADLSGEAGLVEQSLPGEEDRAVLLGSILRDAPGKRRIGALVGDGGDPIGLLTLGIVDVTATIELLVVHPDARGRGAGRALLAVAEDAARRAGAERIAAGGGARRYLWPGVGSSRTAALALFLRHGYRRTGVSFNMGVELAGLPPVPAPRAGISVVPFGEDPAIDAAAIEVAGSFSDGWRFEVGLAVSQPESGGFAAVRDGRVLGFVAHSVFRPTLFGPLGTVEDARGTGIGGLLTLASLTAQRDAGVRTAQIGWIADDALPLYARVAGAEISESFWVLEKELGSGD